MGHKIDRRADAIFDPPQFAPEGDVPYDDTWSLCVPEDPGVYVITDFRGPLYVGRTLSLRRRFVEHFDSHNDLLNCALRKPMGETRFLWITPGIDHLVEAEAYLIKGLAPICNVMLNSCAGQVRQTREMKRTKK
jgi:hypothetical protein